MSLPEKARRDEHEIAELQDLLSRLQTPEADGTIAFKFLPAKVTDVLNQGRNKMNGINRKYILGLCKNLKDEQQKTDAKMSNELIDSLDAFMQELEEPYTDKQKDVYIQKLKAHWKIVSADLQAYLVNPRYTSLQTAVSNKYITKITAGMTSYLSAWTST